MRRLLVLFIFIVSVCVHAQGQTALEQQATQAKLQQMQHEIEMSRLEAQTDKIRLQTELMRLQMERERAQKPREKSLSEVIGEYRSQKAAEEAAAQAEAVRAENSDIASARSADMIYLSVAVVLPLAFGFLIARRAKAKGGTMKHEEKFGVLLMIGALLLGLLALSISENWAPRFDALQNLMLTLKIRLFPESSSSYSPAMIDIYTKYVLLGLVAVAAYGFTTYLGITPAWKKNAAAANAEATLAEILLGITPAWKKNAAAPSQSTEPPKDA
jgi:hypothetical protein